MTVDEAYTLDAKNANTLWENSISKEMKNVWVAFKVLPEGKPAPTVHQFYAIPHGIQHQNGGFQMKVQACGRRPQDQDTSHYYIHQSSV